MALALVDAIIIMAPLAIFLFMLVVRGDYSSLGYKVEWSFVVVFYIIEVIRDQVVVRRLEGYHESHAEAGVAFYSVILSIAVLLLYADYEYSQGFVGLRPEAFNFIKLCFFVCSFVLFMFHRKKKYELLSAQPPLVNFKD